MGDVFHTFPALSDAQAAIPGLEVDWVVEKSFAEIPNWHPSVTNVFAIELRKWRKSLLSRQTRQQINAFFAEVNKQQYDLIIDAQGLLKSVWVARKIKAPIYGMDWKSVREPLASLFYQNKISVAKDQHAIWRLRELFSKALSYDLSNDKPIVYGLDTTLWTKPDFLVEQFSDNDYAVFLHGTTWDTKYWPEEYWVELLLSFAQQSIKVVLPWGNDEEKQRAVRIASHVESHQAWVPEQMLSLNSVAQILKFAKVVVSVDTGLSHVAAALDVPMTVLYRVTDPVKIGAFGPKVVRLESPLSTRYIKKFTDTEDTVLSLKNISPFDVERACFSAMIKEEQF